VSSASQFHRQRQKTGSTANARVYRARKVDMNNTHETAECSGTTHGYLRVLSDFGFDSEDEMHRYFLNEGYASDGIDVDDMAGDLRKALVMLMDQSRLLDRSLAIINTAIMHGMPVTDEVAAARGGSFPGPDMV
jgi:hypothetical protein